MALYEDDVVLTNPGEPAPEGYILKGRMGPVGQEQDYYERARMTPQAPQQQTQAPQNDLGSFLDWAMQTKLGFNPYTMNPTSEAMQKWKSLENQAFNEVFGKSGITASNMTPEALKHWNQQRDMAIKMLMQEASDKQAAGKAYLDMLRKNWEDTMTITDKTVIDPTTGQQVYANKFGQPVPQIGGGGIQKPTATSAAERKRMVDEANLMRMSEDLMVQLTPDAKGKIPADEWTGPVKGRYGQIEEKIKDLPPAQVRFYATIRDMNDFVLRVRSGAQINEQEYKRLTSFLADPNLPTGNLKERVQRFKSNLKWIIGLENRELGREQGQSQAEGKTIVKKQRNTRTGQIKVIYSDGSEEIQ